MHIDATAAAAATALVSDALLYLNAVCCLQKTENQKSTRQPVNQSSTTADQPSALGGIHWTRTDSISIIKAQRKVTSKTKYERSWCPTLSRSQDSSLGVQCATCPVLTAADLHRLQAFMYLTVSEGASQYLRGVVIRFPFLEGCFRWFLNPLTVDRHIQTRVGGGGSASKNRQFIDLAAWNLMCDDVPLCDGALNVNFHLMFGNGIYSNATYSHIFSIFELAWIWFQLQNPFSLFYW